MFIIFLTPARAEPYHWRDLQFTATHFYSYQTHFNIIFLTMSRILKLSLFKFTV
jgi:hypothetical protein